MFPNRYKTLGILIPTFIRYQRFVLNVKDKYMSSSSFLAPMLMSLMLVFTNLVSLTDPVQPALCVINSLIHSVTLSFQIFKSPSLPNRKSFVHEILLDCSSPTTGTYFWLSWLQHVADYCLSF